MYRVSIIFFTISLIFIVLGATEYSGFSLEMGKIMISVFLVLAVVSFTASLLIGKRSSNFLP